MCGIFGMSFQRKAKVPAGQREVIITSLAVANSYRGAQSWGMYVAGQKGKKSRVRREVGDLAEVSGIGSLAQWPVIFGHTRHATTGAVTRENQHPFKVGSILLAHNGMVHNHFELNRKYDRTCTVDSQHFAHHIADDLTFSDIEAYGALEWTDDKRPSTVFLCRMEGGVLSVAGVKNRKGKTVGVVWSSDRKHLTDAMDASRLDWFHFEAMKEGAIYEVTAGQYLSTKRPVLALAPSRQSKWERYASRRLTSGSSFGDGGFDSSDGWWDSRYPNLVASHHTSRTVTSGPASDRPAVRRIYKYDAATRGTTEVTGVGETQSVTITPDDATDADDAEGVMADLDAEAFRLGFVKLDSGMWMNPHTGEPMDVDDLEDILEEEEEDVREEGAALALTESENDSAMSAWERTRAAVANLTHFGKE